MKNPFVSCPKCFHLKRLKAACPKCKFLEDPLPVELYLPYRTHLCSRYRTGIILGKSQRSVIYLALDEETLDIIALKEYFPRLLAERLHGGYVSSRKEQFIEGVSLFRDEFAILQSLEHRSIVQARSILETNGTVYIVMDFCGYESLESQENWAQEEILALMSPIFDALEAVHGSNLLHCDINPANIQLRAAKQPILLDFGSARFQDRRRRELLHPLTFNPGYSAPEQHEGNLDQYRPWTDVYACAATLYRLSTGTKPPPANVRVLNDTIETPRSQKPALTKLFSDAIIQGLSLDPYERPSSIREFRLLLNVDNKSNANNLAPQPSRTSIHVLRLKKSLSAIFSPLILLLIIFGALWLIFGDDGIRRSGVEPEIIKPSLTVAPADFYILRDVSLSIDQKSFDSIEDILRESIRIEDENDGDSDFTSYAHFASWVTDGSPAQPKSLQVAARGDNITTAKKRLGSIDLPPDFRLRTDYKAVFDKILGAITASRAGDKTQERKVIVSLLTDGMPDQEGNRSPCLEPTKDLTIFDSNTLTSFEALAKSRAYILVVLAGGVPNCAGAIKGAWTRAQMNIPPPFRERVIIISLAGYEKDEERLRKRLVGSLRTIRRAPMVAARPSAFQLSDDQRERFDRGDSFYADFSLQPHLCERVRIHLRDAQVLDFEKHPIADLVILNKSPISIAEAGAPRNGEVRTERIYFQPVRGFRPNKEGLYRLKLGADAIYSDKAGAELGIPLVIEDSVFARESASTDMKAGRIGRLEFVVAVYAIVGLMFSAALTLYWHLYVKNKSKRTRRLLRTIFISPLSYWLTGFFAMAAVIFVVSAKLISLNYMLWLVPAGFLLFKSRDLIGRADRAQLSGSDILLSCFDSVLVPLAALLGLLS